MAPGPRAACRHSPVALGLLRPCATLFAEVLCFSTGLCDLGACPGPLQASCSCFPAGVSPCTFDPARFHSASAQGTCQPLRRRHSWERSHCLQVGAWDPGAGAPPYISHSGTHWAPRVGLRRGGPYPFHAPLSSPAWEGHHQGPWSPGRMLQGLAGETGSGRTALLGAQEGHLPRRWASRSGAPRGMPSPGPQAGSEAVTSGAGCSCGSRCRRPLHPGHTGGSDLAR